jgi:hypothetical protein
MGKSYAARHPGGLGRLAKLFDYADRLPYHVHLPQEYASRVGCKSKDEAYYFPEGVDMGAHPESFFGVHPWIARDRRGDVLLPYLEQWDSDLILRHARAERLVADEGFDIPSGVLHAPGTALTLELQEDSDVLSMFQALNAGRIISKELLFKDVRPEDRETHGERFPLNFLDWELNGDPFFYENRHLTPRPRDGAEQAGGNEWWIFWNTRSSPAPSSSSVPAAPTPARTPGPTTCWCGPAPAPSAGRRCGAVNPAWTSSSSRATPPRAPSASRTPERPTW